MMVGMDTRRMCPNCRAFITTSDRTCPYCNEAVAPRAVDRRSTEPILGGFIPHARFCTVIIVLINIGFYLATSLFSLNSGRGSAMNIDVQTLFDFGAKYGPAIAAGQWWRLVTANFLHGGLLHIGMNMWVLFDLGAAVEEMYGAARMLVIYFVAGVLGFYVSTMWNPGVPSVGASAALFGLVGAMVALGMKHRSAIGSQIRSVYMRYVVYLLLFSLLPGIDMAAHIGGLIGGFGIGWLAGEPRYTSTGRENAWKIGAGICILITAYSFLKMYLWFAHAPQ
jgi:membrane associated rhomboid family serine protease